MSEIEAWRAFVKSPEWWRHLRWMKRAFWHRERTATKRDVGKRLDEANKERA